MAEKGSVPRGTLPFCLGTAGVTALGTIIFGEAVHACTAAITRSELAWARTPASVRDGSGQPRRCAVVVLGFANRGSAANAVNRWRARIGARTARRLVGEGWTVSLICCGGPVRGPIPEADHLKHAVRSAGWSGPIELDRTSTSTWQNIEHARRLLQAPAAIAICSNGLHAAKAREYLRRQNAVLATRLIPADDYRFGEMTLVKPLFAAVGLWKLLRANRVSRGTLPRNKPSPRSRHHEPTQRTPRTRRTNLRDLRWHPSGG